VAPQFHETNKGRKFFDNTLPTLITSIDRLAAAIEKSNKKIEPSNITPGAFEDPLHPKDQEINMSTSEIFNADQAIEKVLSDIDKSGEADTGLLDELVHDLVSKTASDINNGGDRSQVEYIISQLGPEGLKSIEQELLQNANKNEK